MSGVVPVYWHGPDTMEVSADVVGGQLVSVDGTTGKVKPSGAKDANCVGVALEDGKLVSEIPTNPISTDFPPPKISIANGVDIRVTYAAGATFGARLVTAANGQVTPYTAGTDDAGKIVGHCTEPGGATTGQVKRAYIHAI